MSEKNYKAILQRHRIVMLAEAGSKLLGLSSAEKSDRDEMGITLETPAQLLGFATFEHDVYRSAEDRTGKIGAPSEPGDVDLTLYGLRKFARLALGGNPNIISMLFVPQNKCITYTNLAKELQKLAPKFISLRVGKAFLGYLTAQRERLVGSRGQKNVNRQELVAEHGYDTKYAAHAIRLAIQGNALLETGKLEFPIDEASRKFTLAIRHGDYSFSNVIAYLSDYEENLVARIHDNRLNLPDTPDYEAVEKWLLSVYERAWHGDSQLLESPTKG